MLHDSLSSIAGGRRLRHVARTHTHSLTHLSLTHSTRHRRRHSRVTDPDRLGRCVSASGVRPSGRSVRAPASGTRPYRRPAAGRPTARPTMDGLRVLAQRCPSFVLLSLHWPRLSVSMHAWPLAGHSRRAQLRQARTERVCPEPGRVHRERSNETLLGAELSDERGLAHVVLAAPVERRIRHGVVDAIH